MDNDWDERPLKSLIELFPRERYSPSQAASNDLKLMLENENSQALINAAIHYADIAELLNIYPYYWELLEQPTVLTQLATRYGLLPARPGLGLLPARPGLGLLPARPGLGLLPAHNFRHLLELYDRRYITLRSYLYQNRTTAEVLIEACRLGDLEVVSEGLRIIEGFLSKPRTRSDYRKALDESLIAAAQGGHLGIVQRLKSLGARHPSAAIKAAIEARQPDTRNWLVVWAETDLQAPRLQVEDYAKFSLAALRSGHEALFFKLAEKWASTDHFTDRTAFTLILLEALRQGSLKVFEWVKDRVDGEHLWDRLSELFYAAAEGGQIVMLEQLRQYYSEFLEEEEDVLSRCFDLALKAEAWDMVAHLIVISENDPLLLRELEDFKEALRLKDPPEIPLEDYDPNVLARLAALEVGNPTRVGQLLDLEFDRKLLWEAAAQEGELPVIKLLLEEGPKSFPAAIVENLRKKLREEGLLPQLRLKLQRTLVWLLEHLALDHVWVDGDPLDFKAYAAIAMKLNEVDLLEVMLHSEDSTNFRNWRLPVPYLPYDVVEEGVLEVILTGKFYEPLTPPSSIEFVRADNLIAYRYLTENGLGSSRYEALKLILGVRDTSKILDYLMARGPLDAPEEVKPLVKIACHWIARGNYNRDFLVYFVRRVIKEALQHPLPILEEVCKSGNEELIKLLLSYPGYNRVKLIYCLKGEEGEDLSKDLREALEALDPEELLTEIIELGPQAGWMMKYLSGAEERLEARIADYLRSEDPRLLKALVLKESLRPVRKMTEVFEYYEALWELSTSEEQRRLLEGEMFLVATEILKNIKKWSEEDVLVVEKLLSRGLPYADVEKGLKLQDNSFGILRLQRTYDPDWPNIAENLARHANSWEELKKLIDLGYVVRQELIDFYMDHSKIKLLRELGSLGLVDVSGIDWEAMRQKVFNRLAGKK